MGYVKNDAIAGRTVLCGHDVHIDINKCTKNRKSSPAKWRRALCPRHVSYTPPISDEQLR